jgi:hypothetical protein
MALGAAGHRIAPSDASASTSLPERSRSASPRTQVRQETARLGQAPCPKAWEGEVIRRVRTEAAGPVTSQVTTAQGCARRSTTRSDTDIFLTYGNPT